MKIGVNTVLFGGFDLRTAFETIAFAGYEAIELSAINGMGEHLIVSRWQELAPEIRKLSKDFNLPITAIERSALDLTGAEQSFQAAAELGIPIVNFGPGGKSGDEASWQQSIETIGNLVIMAEKYGVICCVKAHVGGAVYNTPTTLRLMEAINSPAFGIDMDPSHIYRAGENPVDAIQAVISRVKHVHIRDCKGRQSGPGKPEDQANGRGDIDLIGYMRALYQNGYTGPVNLEIIGARQYSLTRCAMIASESRGHMQACLQVIGARP